MTITKAYVKLDEADKDGKNIGLNKFFNLGEGAKTKIFSVRTPPNRDEPIVRVESHAISRALEVVGSGVLYEDDLLEEIPNPYDSRDSTMANIFERNGYVQVEEFAES
ncbi:MAG: hypothetical protein HY296_06300 [Thaumarchaeota archaeon]|nr:hypothetical protein [Nitrososphaerota archaeon]